MNKEDFRRKKRKPCFVSVFFFKVDSSTERRLRGGRRCSKWSVQSGTHFGLRWGSVCFPSSEWSVFPQMQCWTPLVCPSVCTVLRITGGESIRNEVSLTGVHFNFRNQIPWVYQEPLFATVSISSLIKADFSLAPLQRLDLELSVESSVIICPGSKGSRYCEEETWGNYGSWARYGPLGF